MMRLRLFGKSVMTCAVLGPMLGVMLLVPVDLAFSRRLNHAGFVNTILGYLWAAVLAPIVFWQIGILAGLLGGALCLLLIELGVARHTWAFCLALGALLGALLALLSPEVCVAAGGKLASSSMPLRVAATLSGGVCGTVVASYGWNAVNS